MASVSKSQPPATPRGRSPESAGSRSVIHRNRRSRALAAPLLAVVLPLVTSCSTLYRGEPWWLARRDPSHQAPDPASTPEAVIQVYAARTVGWRGVFAVHTWIVVKRENAPAYTRYEVIGWGVDRGMPAIRVNRAGPDDHWFGARPELLADLRGVGVDALVERVESAVAAYPYPDSYRTWPGPNSNTFIAWIARSVPEMRLELPPTAIGKNYLPGPRLVARSPGGRGAQVSVLGVLGILAGWDEGVEVDVLGLTFGVGFRHPSLKLPLVGRIAVP
jgi:uncharacterized protein DUF3750